MASSKQSIHKKCFLPLFLREVVSYKPSVLRIISIVSDIFSVYVSFLNVLALLKPRDSLFVFAIGNQFPVVIQGCLLHVLS